MFSTQYGQEAMTRVIVRCGLSQVLLPRQRPRGIIKMLQAALCCQLGYVGHRLQHKRFARVSSQRAAKAACPAILEARCPCFQHTRCQRSRVSWVTGDFPPEHFALLTEADILLL